MEAMVNNTLLNPPLQNQNNLSRGVRRRIEGTARSSSIMLAVPSISPYSADTLVKFIYAKLSTELCSRWNLFFHHCHL